MIVLGSPPVPLADKLPWAGTFRGKKEIADFFAHVAQNLEFSEFAPREMIEQGDTVVVLGTPHCGRSKKTGKIVKNERAHVFKFSQGKAISFSGIHRYSSRCSCNDVRALVTTRLQFQALRRDAPWACPRAYLSVKPFRKFSGA